MRRRAANPQRIVAIDDRGNLQSWVPLVSTHLRLPPIMFASSPRTSRTTSSTVAGACLPGPPIARKRAVNWQACRRLHSSNTAPHQSPAR